MKELHDRINRVINTRGFRDALDQAGIPLFEFQFNWVMESQGNFDNLRAEYRHAIEAGEKELSTGGLLELAAA
jgi:hypothetical protein